MNYLRKLKRGYSYKNGKRTIDFVGKSACLIMFIALLAIDSESSIPIVTAFTLFPIVVLYLWVIGAFEN